MSGSASRNAPCACGSGKRFKHCCGREGAEAAPKPTTTRNDALAAHRAGSLRLAETLYRRALEENPADVDVLHMLGVVQLERLRYREALGLILDAAERTAWARADIRHNLGLAIGKLLVRGVAARQATLVEEFLAWEASHAASRTAETPLVSVVMPAYNHARFVGEAIASVAAQTYPNLELVIVDDGSTDATAEVIAREIEGLPFPVRFVSRANRGAPATLNEGAAMANGKYLSFLNSDDYYAPDRVASLVDDIARAGLPWGFTLVAQVAEGAAQSPPASAAGSAPITDATASAPAGSYWQVQRSLLGSDSNSFALVQNNVAVSTGNLFVEREFFQSLGGFHELRYNHDWDFCLRASALAEPMVVRRPLYFYRMHESNTIRESGAQAAAEADQVLGELIATTLAGKIRCANPLAPQWPENRTLLLTRVLGAGQGALVPVPALRELALELRSEASSETTQPEAAPQDKRRIAVVVLGMHRSGTSAFARALNLCGAFLPAELRVANAYHNPTGFWEPEAIVNLNERVLRQAAGAWNQVDFAPPQGMLADDFVHDARAFLASEYGDAPTILIKDPRIAILAPLWHRALTEAGYRAVYVVPLRDPIEVARSLEARGDMTVQEGLALWLAYMDRIATFTESVPDVIHMRFTDLFTDWRGAIGRIAVRLDVPLDIEGRAEEVDRFLEPSLRRQRSDAEALAALPAGGINDDVRARYAALVAQCDQSAGGGTAVVVLGMHRSGTSALSRVLNLCGAYLPANLRPPKLRNNPKGSWEPEEVVNLNERVLRHLGAAWNHVGFTLPEGEFVDEFVHDARALLASEYGEQSTILIKDPRVCVLAPLWERALSSAGYRSIYLVPIRDPIEVARSLEARGDMTVSEGLALWTAYMKRVAEFATSAERVMYLRYTDLIADWRSVVGRAARRFDLALDVEGRADEVDRYLEPGLRRQRAETGALDVLANDPDHDELRTLYRAALARCDDDAKASPEVAVATSGRVEIASASSAPAVATASFVLCIENNAIRDQAILLCESIRQFGGRYRDSPILAFSPRTGLAVDGETRRVLVDMGVEYVDEPLNTTCRDYSPANRVFAGKWAEQHVDTDFVVVLDSDTVYLKEPEMPAGDVAVRPVDSKGSATRGPGDAFEDYWVALCAMCGTTTDRLPYLRATIDGQRIRASYNAGLIVCRRDRGIFTRGADLFSESLAAGMRPYRGSGIDIFASTGPVGQAGSEFWGSSQAVLAIAIWATTDRVLHYPPTYNLPLHLVAATGEIDPVWTAAPPVHVHYHYMFTPQRVEIAMEIMAKLGVTEDRLAWLADRVPFADPAQARHVA